MRTLCTAPSRHLPPWPPVFASPSLALTHLVEKNDHLPLPDGSRVEQWSLPKKGTLTAKEQVELDNYERVGHMLSLMKSKARRSLKDEQDNGTAKPHRARMERTQELVWQRAGNRCEYCEP